MMQVVAKLGTGWPFGCSRDGMKFEGSALVRRWLHEEHGQDLIEYALLCSAIGFAGAVAFTFISSAMNTTYTSWDNAVQDDLLVEVPPPAEP
jgi:Flp pilus assembly pilin Flp